MKNIILILFLSTFIGNSFAQSLPNDVEKIYKAAEKMQSKKEFDKAVDLYKKVLQSVPTHYNSMENIGDIELRLRAKPNYRQAFEYYQKAIDVLNSGISSAEKNKVKKYLTGEKDRITPKFNKAKSHVKDFDKAKDNHEKGKRLLDDEDLN
jgi:tetratricopeptide (TPR) repeat protein